MDACIGDGYTRRMRAGMSVVSYAVLCATGWSMGRVCAFLLCCLQLEVTAKSGTSLRENRQDQSRVYVS